MITHVKAYNTDGTLSYFRYLLAHLSWGLEPRGSGNEHFPSSPTSYKGSPHIYKKRTPNTYNIRRGKHNSTSLLRLGLELRSRINILSCLLYYLCSKCSRLEALHISQVKVCKAFPRAPYCPLKTASLIYGQRWVSGFSFSLEAGVVSEQVDEDSNEDEGWYGERFVEMD